MQLGALTSGTFPALPGGAPNTFVGTSRFPDVILDFAGDTIGLNVGTFATGSITPPGPTGNATTPEGGTTFAFLAGTLFNFLFHPFTSGGTTIGSSLPVVFGTLSGVTSTRFVTATSSGTTSIGGLFNSQASAGAFASFLSGLGGLSGLTSRSFLVFGVNTAQSRLFVAVAAETAGSVSDIGPCVLGVHRCSGQRWRLWECQRYLVRVIAGSLDWRQRADGEPDDQNRVATPKVKE